MGYQMVYGQSVCRARKSYAMRLRIMISLCLLIFSILVRTCWDSGAEKLRNLIIPGEMTSADLAFRSLMEDLREGESVGDSLEVFCRSVLNGEN